MKRALIALILGVIALAAVLLFNTFRFRSKQVQVEPVPAIAIDTNAIATRLSQAVRFQTVSSQDAKENHADQFIAFQEFLKQSFPKVHATLAKEIVAEHSMLFTWKGRDESAAPILLMGHQDVVPVEPGTESNWTHPPFEGQIADGYVWGRGTLDDKATVMGLFEAMEQLLTDGFQPDRTIYFAFGHDEEIGGLKGASAIAALLRDRGVKPDFVLDEGGVISTGILPGLSSPVALIGIAEKGFA